MSETGLHQLEWEPWAGREASCTPEKRLFLNALWKRLVGAAFGKNSATSTKLNPF
jgi:hypothetical protein